MTLLDRRQDPTPDDGTVVWESDLRQPDGSRAAVSIHARTGKAIDRPGD